MILSQPLSPDYTEFHGFQRAFCSLAVVTDRVAGPSFFHAGAPKMSQGNWRWCKKCQMLHYAGGALGPCPKEGLHSVADSGEYFLILNNPGYPGQAGWKWCQTCKGLSYTPLAAGECAEDVAHDNTGSSNYKLVMTHEGAVGQ